VQVVPTVITSFSERILLIENIEDTTENFIGHNQDTLDQQLVEVEGMV